MKILIDILHPAHVHFFRNFLFEMRARDHEVVVTARVKDRATELLDAYGIEHVVLSEQRSGVGLALEMVSRTTRLNRVIGEHKPDVLTGIMGPSIAVAGKLRRLPAIVFYDTEFARQTNWFVYPLAHSVCTPDSYQGRVRGRHVTYSGYHELAYLHPSRFQPDPSKLSEFGLSATEPFFLLRFVSWEAIHDIREVGLTREQKEELLRTLSEHGKVVISSEGAIPPELEEHRLRGPVNEIHHVLAHAQMIVGESATMSSEAAVLGVPAVFIAKTGRGYTDDQERRYGLVRHFTPEKFHDALATTRELAAAQPREVGAAAREKLLSDKIDVTSWMVEYFEANV